MVKIYYFISVYLLLFACNNSNTQENNYIENDIDTIEEADYVQEITDERITREIKDKNYVIFVEPTLFYLDSLKNVSKYDDFYTTVDDATFYMTMASDLALEKRIDTINIKIGEILKIGKKIIQVSKDNPWTLILYKQGGKTKELYPIEIQIDDKLLTFFSMNKSVYPNTNKTYWREVGVRFCAKTFLAWYCL